MRRRSHIHAHRTRTLVRTLARTRTHTDAASSSHPLTHAYTIACARSHTHFFRAHVQGARPASFSGASPPGSPAASGVGVGMEITNTGVCEKERCLVESKRAKERESESVREGRIGVGAICVAEHVSIRQNTIL